MTRRLDTWISRLANDRLVAEGDEAARSELESWLGSLEAAARGDRVAEYELMRLVAIHARASGASGHPASASLMRMLHLSDAMEPAREGESEVLRNMLRVVVDAHALGLTDRIERRHRDLLRNGSPIICLGDHTVVAFMIGEMHAEIVDALLGRALHVCAGRGARVLAIDVSAAALDNDVFHRTILAIVRGDDTKRLHIALVGVRNRDTMRRALEALGCDVHGIAFFDCADDVIAAALMS